MNRQVEFFFDFGNPARLDWLREALQTPTA